MCDLIRSWESREGILGDPSRRLSPERRKALPERAREISTASPRRARSFLYRAALTALSLSNRFSRARPDVKMLSRARHIGHCLQLIHRTARHGALSPIRWWSNVSRVSIIYLCRRIHSACASICRFVHCTRVLPLSCRGGGRKRETRHDVTKPILYVAAYVVPLHNNSLPSGREPIRRLSAFDR